MQRRVFFVLLSLSLSTGYVCAQSSSSQQDAAAGKESQPPPQPADGERLTRTEELLEKRRARASELKANRLSGNERTLLWMEKGGLRQILGFNYKGIYPKVATLSTGSGFAPSVRVWQPDLAKTSLDLQATAAYSTRGYQKYELQFGMIEKRGTSFSLGPFGVGAVEQFDELQPKEPGLFGFADLTYRYFPQEDFFGLGPASLRMNRTNYRVEDMSYDLAAGWQANRWLGAAFRAGYLQVDLGSGTDSRFPDTEAVFNDIEAPGLARQPDFLNIVAAVLVDFRDRPGNPHKGGGIGVYFSHFDERGGDEFEFERFAVDARQFLPLGSEQRVLALRFFASSDEADNGARIPFYLQESLGGSETLRGFREFRFRGDRLLHFSAEYRWEASPALELAVFYDTGRVYSADESFDLDHLEKSIGGGVRLKTPRRTLLRLDVGRSHEGTRFYFKFGPSF